MADGIPQPGRAHDAPPRHALLRVRVEAWAALLANEPERRDDPLLAAWALRGWPLIARRRDARDRPDHIPAGLPLPPSHGKGRLSFELSPDAVCSIDAPPLLRVILAGAPTAWIATIEALCALGDRIGSRPRVFGSFAWAALTGLAYVGPQSDLDLLWPVGPQSDVDALLSGLAVLERDAPGAIDGELVLEPSAMAANWREVMQENDQVLVKTLEGVAMGPVTAFRPARGAS